MMSLLERFRCLWETNYIRSGRTLKNLWINGQFLGKGNLKKRKREGWREGSRKEGRKGKRNEKEKKGRKKEKGRKGREGNMKGEKKKARSV